MKSLTLSMLTTCIILVFANTQKAWSYGHGISTYPLTENLGLLTTEITGMVSDGRGMGLQARYTHKLNPLVTLEGGAGFGKGENSDRFFIAGDLELFPDYGRQPKVALRGNIEMAAETQSRRTIIGLGPVITKQFPLGLTTVSPFFALPIGLTLDRTTKKYQVRMTAAFGVTGPFPSKKFQNLLYNFEGNLNIENSFSSLYMGLTLPVN